MLTLVICICKNLPPAAYRLSEDFRPWLALVRTLCLVHKNWGRGRGGSITPMYNIDVRPSIDRLTPPYAHTHHDPTQNQAYAAVLGTAFNYNAYSYAGTVVAPGVISIYSTLQPLGTAILSFMFFHSKATTGEILGGVLVVLGLIITVVGREQEARWLLRQQQEKKLLEQEGEQGGGGAAVGGGGGGADEEA